MTHKELTDLLFSDKPLNVLDKDLRKFTTYFHRPFYNLPFMTRIINQYLNDMDYYVKPREYFEFLQDLIKRNKIKKHQLTSIFPKKKPDQITDAMKNKKEIIIT
jgi:hypothetical protein